VGIPLFLFATLNGLLTLTQGGCVNLDENDFFARGQQRKSIGRGLKRSDDNKKMTLASNSAFILKLGRILLFHHE